jgi:hypothetical protein
LPSGDFDTAAFKNWATNSGRLLPESLRDSAQEAGAEHEVWFQNGRVFKAAYNPHTVLLDDDGRLTLGPERSVSAYLHRIKLQNLLFDDDIRIEGLIIEESGGRLIPVISQPIVGGRKPTMDEISMLKKSKGFVAVAPQIKGWYQPGARILVADAHDRNLVVTTNGLFAFDLIITTDCKVVDAIESFANLTELPESKEDDL